VPTALDRSYSTESMGGSPRCDDRQDGLEAACWLASSEGLHRCGPSNDLWNHNLIRPLALRELPDLKLADLRFRFAAGDRW
jgi:hypothetical protein